MCTLVWGGLDIFGFRVSQGERDPVFLVIILQVQFLWLCEGITVAAMPAPSIMHIPQRHRMAFQLFHKWPEVLPPLWVIYLNCQKGKLSLYFFHIWLCEYLSPWISKTSESTER